MDKILSVSIAAYNVEQYIEQTLDSFIVPSVMEDIEVIIVNDGSKDKTAEKVSKYVEKYPNTFKLINKENGGWGSTVNTAIEVASGKYFKLLDGDDWFDKDTLTNYVDELKKAKTDLIFTKFTQCYEDSEKVEIVEQDYPYGEVLGIEAISKVSMHALTILTDLLKKNNVKLLENCFYTDVEFFVRSVLCAQNFISLPVNVYCYRLGRAGQSVSYEGYIKHIDEHELVTKTVLSIVNNDSRLKLLRSNLTIIVAHVSMLIFLKTTTDNLNRFILFKKYLVRNYPDIAKETKKKLSFINRVVYTFPRLFYKTVSKLKRKKYNIV